MRSAYCPVLGCKLLHNKALITWSNALMTSNSAQQLESNRRSGDFVPALDPVELNRSVWPRVVNSTVTREHVAQEELPFAWKCMALTLCRCHLGANELNCPVSRHWSFNYSLERHRYLQSWRVNPFLRRGAV